MEDCFVFLLFFSFSLSTVRHNKLSPGHYDNFLKGLPLEFREDGQDYEGSEDGQDYKDFSRLCSNLLNNS